MTGYIGLKDANIFDYRAIGNASNSNPLWRTSAGGTGSATVPEMAYRRWYPTNTSLGGSLNAQGSQDLVLVVAGQQWDNQQAELPEVWTSANTWRTLSGATRALPLYPWMFLAPNGRVFNAGPNKRTGFLDLAGTGSWTDGPPMRIGGAMLPATYAHTEREAGTAVMYAPGQLLILGGIGSSTAQPVARSGELLDLNTLGAQWQPAADMAFPRMHVNATVLADGTVLVTGGSSKSSVIESNAILPAELWTPPTAAAPGGTWTTLNAMRRARLYHSTAVLLPDATVLSTGGGQGGGGDGQFDDHADFELFTPPYLCRGLARPRITSAPQTVVYGQPFIVVSPEAGNIRRYGRAALVRLSSVTHSFNMNQLYIPLALSAGAASNELSLMTPTNPNVCPPGHYMLFLIDGNGTPSHASIVAVGSSACATTLSIAHAEVG